MAKNMVASTQRVRAVIKKLLDGGFKYVGWTEDGPYDSPKLEMLAPKEGEPVMVAVDCDPNDTKHKFIAVMDLRSPSLGYTNYDTVEEYLAAYQPV